MYPKRNMFRKPVSAIRPSRDQCQHGHTREICENFVT